MRKSQVKYLEHRLCTLMDTEKLCRLLRADCAQILSREALKFEESWEPWREVIKYYKCQKMGSHVLSIIDKATQMMCDWPRTGQGQAY